MDGTTCIGGSHVVATLSQQAANSCTADGVLTGESFLWLALATAGPPDPEALDAYDAVRTRTPPDARVVTTARNFALPAFTGRAQAPVESGGLLRTVAERRDPLGGRHEAHCPLLGHRPDEGDDGPLAGRVVPRGRDRSAGRQAVSPHRRHPGRPAVCAGRPPGDPRTYGRSPWREPRARARPATRSVPAREAARSPRTRAATAGDR